MVFHLKNARAAFFYYKQAFSSNHVSGNKKNPITSMWDLQNTSNLTATVWGKFPSKFCLRKACSLPQERLMLETTEVRDLRGLLGFQSHVLYHRTVTASDPQFSNMEKLSKTMSQQETLKKRNHLNQNSEAANI